MAACRKSLVHFLLEQWHEDRPVIPQEITLIVAEESMNQRRFWGNPWTLGDKYDQVYPHHESISALWNLEWKAACQRSTYPFHDGKIEDFEPIFASLIEKGIHDGYSDEFSHEFFATAERLEAEGDGVIAADSNRPQARELYLRSCAVYRIGRFPYIIGDEKRKAYEAQKRVYTKATALFDRPVRNIEIPHGAAIDGEGEVIPAYVCLPGGVTKSDRCPVILIMCGLDGHRPDFTLLLEELTGNRGWAVILVDIPGTADCPADRRDSAAPDRMWTSVLEWMRSEEILDMHKVVCWGLSAGGYYGVRAAHTHAEDFVAAVGQGAGTHQFFSRDWLEKGQWHEYPWTFLPALTEKFGCESDEDFLEHAQADFSLVESGLVDMPSCRLLLVNGTQDGLMPIEDSTLLLEHGSPKEARFFPGLTHMGNPAALNAILSWLESVLGI